MSHSNESGMITITKQKYDDAIRDAVKLAIKLEREECASIVETIWQEARDTEFDLGFETARKCFAAALRRQGQGDKGT